MNNRFKIIVPFYNAAEFLETCVVSLNNQKYDNYQILFVDDCSTDNSFDLLPPNNDKSLSIKNDVRKTALENIHDCIMNHCSTDDIVVLVDGDDYLPTKNVLNQINDFYNKNDCWIMYGQATWTTGQKGIARPYTSKEEFENKRNLPFYVSHIRTFRAGLYHKIAEQDPGFSCMKDSNGKFYLMTYDVAIMYPIMELAGFDKTKYNDTSLYVYNKGNPISDDKVDWNLQYSIHQEILRKKPFLKIDSYKNG